MRRAVTGAALTVVATCLTILPAVPAPASPAAPSTPASGSTATATTPKVDYEALALKIAVEINAARMNPTGMADALEKLAPGLPAGGSRLKLADGATLWTDKAYLDQSIAEARKQTVLKPLAWSPKLAKLSKDWAPSAARGAGHGNYQTRTAGIGGNGWIEAISGGDPNPLAYVYGHWISYLDKWPRATEFCPDCDFSKKAGQPNAVPWRGHRGIVNDNRMTAIGVACAPASGTNVTCVINDGINMPDESPMATPAKGGPALDKIAGPIDGSVGSTPLDPKVTVDLSTSDKAEATPTEPPSVPEGELASADVTSASSASPGAGASSAAPSTAVPSPSASAPSGDCAGASEAAPSPAENAARLRCLIDNARAAAGLPAYAVNKDADYLALLATGRTKLNEDKVCGTKFRAGSATGQVPEPTAQKAFDAMGGAKSKWVTSGETDLGVGFGNGQFGLYRAACR